MCGYSFYNKKSMCQAKGIDKRKKDMNINNNQHVATLSRFKKRKVFSNINFRKKS